MHKEVEVLYLFRGLYGIYAKVGEGLVQLLQGNVEQVHSWLGQHGYKLQQDGTYRREGLGNAG